MMDVKLNTKEAFTVITPREPHLAVNMADDFAKLLHQMTSAECPHMVLDFQHVEQMDDEIAGLLATQYAQCLERGISFVLCNVQTGVMERLKSIELSDLLNITPTESEAWDIIHMEAIERELLNGENDDAC
ncbi:MAG: STAS domain-containing protein [Ferruginibacter sp.]|nr:STAS domain-containing protein [Ferruginibacter sp.]